MMETHALRSLQKKRTTNFREDETKLLIQLWGSPQIQNKLYLTHRKEPVMRLLAANMHQRGFYRTADEIKTRIRNLKCLYHRIKRTVQSGSGIGTVDPDWPHYKAMDRILSKQNQKKDNPYGDNVFEGPRCEDIKQEVEDIDINNDDMDSYTTNSLGGSECDEEQNISMPPLTPAPNNTNNKEMKKYERTTHLPQQHGKVLPKILPNLTIPVQTSSNQGNNKQPNISSLPFPLLILNGVQPQQNQLNNNNPQEKSKDSNRNSHDRSDDINKILKELLDVQKENLDIEKQRLELEKQRLEFERFVGSQLLAMGPVFSGLLQRIVLSNSGILAHNNEPNTEEIKNGRKRASTSNLDLLKDSKILRTLLNEGIKKYMMGEEDGHDDEESDNEEDSGVQNDENSNASSNK